MLIASTILLCLLSQMNGRIIWNVYEIQGRHWAANTWIWILISHVASMCGKFGESGGCWDGSIISNLSNYDLGSFNLIEPCQYHTNYDPLTLFFSRAFDGIFIFFFPFTFSTMNQLLCHADICRILIYICFSFRVYIYILQRIIILLGFW